MHVESIDAGVGTGDPLPMKSQRRRMRALNLTFRAWRKHCRMSAEQGCTIRVVFQEDHPRDGIRGCVERARTPADGIIRRRASTLQENAREGEGRLDWRGRGSRVPEGGKF